MGGVERAGMGVHPLHKMREWGSFLCGMVWDLVSESLTRDALMALTAEEQGWVREQGGFSVYSRSNMNPRTLSGPGRNHHAAVCFIRCKTPDWGAFYLPLGLTHVELVACGIRDASGVEFPPGLTHLSLAYNEIVDIKALRLGERLQVLDVEKNWIKDVSGWEMPAALLCLFMAGNQIEEFNVAPMPPRLDTVNLAGNRLTRIPAMSPQVLCLNLNSNLIRDVSNAALPPSLTFFIMQDNPVEDAYPLLCQTQSLLNLIMFEFVPLASDEIGCAMWQGGFYGCGATRTRAMSSLLVLLSARANKRIGKDSAMNRLPVDLCRYTKNFLL